MAKELKEQPHYLGHRNRLRERFLIDEGDSMADYELLEMLLALAIPRRDVKEKAKDLIKHFGSYANVVSAPQNKLYDYGLSVNVVSAIKLVKASAKRFAWHNLKETNEPIIANMDYLLEYYTNAMAYLEVEEFRVMFLDAKLQVLKEEVMQKGSVNSVQVHPREIVKAAIKYNATSVVLAHNHPSGKLQPSHNDLEMTKKIIDALKTIDVLVGDHLIITKQGYYSFLESGLLERIKR